MVNIMCELKENNTNFIRERIKSDIEKGVCSDIITRFPPEPNA